VKLAIVSATDVVDLLQTSASPVLEIIIWNLEPAGKPANQDFTQTRPITFAESVMTLVGHVLDRRQTNVSVAREQTNSETIHANQNAKI